MQWTVQRKLIKRLRITCSVLWCGAFQAIFQLCYFFFCFARNSEDFPGSCSQKPANQVQCWSLFAIWRGCFCFILCCKLIPRYNQHFSACHFRSNNNFDEWLKNATLSGHEPSKDNPPPLLVCLSLNFPQCHSCAPHTSHPQWHATPSLKCYPPPSYQPPPPPLMGYMSPLMSYRPRPPHRLVTLLLICQPNFKSLTFLRWTKPSPLNSDNLLCNDEYPIWRVRFVSPSCIMTRDRGQYTQGVTKIVLVQIAEVKALCFCVWFSGDHLIQHLHFLFVIAFLHHVARGLTSYSEEWT